MNQKLIVFLALFVVACASLVCAQDFANQQEQQQQQANPNCPVQRTMSFVQSLMNRMRSMSNGASQMSSNGASRMGSGMGMGGSMSFAVPNSVESLPVNRRKRETSSGQIEAPAALEPIAPVTAASSNQQAGQQLPAVIPRETPTAQDVIKYNENIKREENQLTHMLRSMMNNKYMPTRDQIIQLASTVLTLLLMLMLGPVMGANAGLIQSIVKQVVPFVVSYGVHYAADQALPPSSIEAPITNVQLEPVSVPRSVVAQTI